MGSAVSPFREVWLHGNHGQSLCALINGDIGLLMYLRYAGDAGFSSRNPDFAGTLNEMVEYRLSNGQVDHYPRAWAYPLGVVEQALDHFRATEFPATFIEWHNDSGDGKPIIPRESRYR